MHRFFDGDRTITLRDGRALGYCMLGDPRGQPVIFVGGYPGSRLMARLFDGALERGIRLVGIDRPGAGLSDFKPGWEILDFPGDLVELADQLSLDRFAVLGWSGGGPYALACAYQVPERLSAVGLIASIGVPEVEVQGAMKRNQVWQILARRAPWLLRPLLWMLYGRFGYDPGRFKASLVKMQEEISPPDRHVYAREEVLSIMAAGMAEAYRQGMVGQAHEARLLYNPWGFCLEQIQHPSIHLWHGEQDQNIPAVTGRMIASAISGCHARFYPDEGHLSILVNRAGEILESLVG